MSACAAVLEAWQRRKKKEEKCVEELEGREYCVKEGRGRRRLKNLVEGGQGISQRERVWRKFVVHVFFFWLVCVCRSAMLNVLKVLKLLLVSAAYAAIFQVVIELKQEEKTVSEERHTKAKQLQTALEQIIPASEHKLKTVSMNLAKLFVDKVICICAYRDTIHSKPEASFVTSGTHVTL